MPTEAIIALVLIVVLVLGINITARRYGYNVGGDVVVQCRRGDLFTTIWIAGASFTSVRLGWVRIQRCPVGRHWSLVTLIKEADLTDEQRRLAAEHRDVRIP